MICQILLKATVKKLTDHPLKSGPYRFLKFYRPIGKPCRFGRRTNRSSLFFVYFFNFSFSFYIRFNNRVFLFLFLFFLFSCQFEDFNRTSNVNLDFYNRFTSSNSGFFLSINCSNEFDRFARLSIKNKRTYFDVREESIGFDFRLWKWIVRNDFEWPNELVEYHHHRTNDKSICSFDYSKNFFSFADFSLIPSINTMNLQLFFIIGTFFH